MDHPVTARLTAHVVIREGDHYLFVEEDQDEGRSINFPAGHIELGETPIEGARREAKEETGLDVKITGLITVISFAWKSGMQAVRFVFEGVRIGGKEKPEEGSKLHWLTAEEIRAGLPGIKPVRLLDEVMTLVVASHRVDPNSVLFYDNRREALEFVGFDSES